ncbi:MAG: NIPSNAP family protein [Mycobacteriales bacterium]
MSRWSQRIVELRQYTLRPGQRDVLIELFDREFVESQEAAGMAILGQFRDLDDPDRFVWLRGFPDMESRARALGDFYGGPVWKAHRDAANATMIDSDDVLLLRPVPQDGGFPIPDSPRPPVGSAGLPESVLVATVCRYEEKLVDTFEREVRPALGTSLLACFRTEHSPNTFPALPVREGEDVFVWFARFPTLDSVDRLYTGPGQRLRLAPTARSSLR